jgi:hypothetical protein
VAKPADKTAPVEAANSAPVAAGSVAAPTPLAPLGTPAQIKTPEAQAAGQTIGQAAPQTTMTPAALASQAPSVPVKPPEGAKTEAPAVNPTAGTAVKKKLKSNSFIITVIIAGVVIAAAVAALFIFVINRQAPSTPAPAPPVVNEREEINTAEAVERIMTFLAGLDSQAEPTSLTYSVDPEATEAELPSPCPTFAPVGQSWGTNVVNCSGVSMYLSVSGRGLAPIRASVREYILSLDLDENYAPKDENSIIAESFANETTVCSFKVSPIGFNGLQAEVVVYCADVSGYYKRLEDMKAFVEAYRAKMDNYISLYYATDTLIIEPSTYEPYEFVRLGTGVMGHLAAFYRTGRNGSWVYSKNASGTEVPACADLDINERRGFLGWLECPVDGGDTPEEPETPEDPNALCPPTGEVDENGNPVYNDC